MSFFSFNLEFKTTFFIPDLHSVDRILRILIGYISIIDKLFEYNFRVNYVSDYYLESYMSLLKETNNFQMKDGKIMDIPRLYEFK